MKVTVEIDAEGMSPSAIGARISQLAGVKCVTVKRVSEDAFVPTSRPSIMPVPHGNPLDVFAKEPAPSEKQCEIKLADVLRLKKSLEDRPERIGGRTAPPRDFSSVPDDLEAAVAHLYPDLGEYDEEVQTGVWEAVRGYLEWRTGAAVPPGGFGGNRREFL